jgi:hypothetical protein
MVVETNVVPFTEESGEREAAAPGDNVASDAAHNTQAPQASLR